MATEAQQEGWEESIIFVMHRVEMWLECRAEEGGFVLEG